MAVNGAVMPAEEVATRYFEQIAQLARSVDLIELQAVVDALRKARDADASVFIIGNGGSAATASHLATDLANAPKRTGLKPLRVFSLTDNTACLTALGNDEGFESVFTARLENYVRAGDVVIAISASGKSPNVVEAVKFAACRGAVTVGLVGFDGGMVKNLTDHCLLVSSEMGAYGPVEDVHLMLGHILTACLTHA